MSAEPAKLAPESPVPVPLSTMAPPETLKPKLSPDVLKFQLLLIVSDEISPV